MLLMLSSNTNLYSLFHQPVLSIRPVFIEWWLSNQGMTVKSWNRINNSQPKAKAYFLILTNKRCPKTKRLDLTFDTVYERSGSFLDAPSHLYMWSCPSVRRSVRTSAGPSVRPLVPCYLRRWKVRILGVSFAVYPALLLTYPTFSLEKIASSFTCLSMPTRYVLIYFVSPSSVGPAMGDGLSTLDHFPLALGMIFLGVDFMFDHSETSKKICRLRRRFRVMDAPPSSSLSSSSSSALRYWMVWHQHTDRGQSRRYFRHLFLLSSRRVVHSWIHVDPIAPWLFFPNG